MQSNEKKNRKLVKIGYSFDEIEKKYQEFIRKDLDEIEDLMEDEENQDNDDSDNDIESENDDLTVQEYQKLKKHIFKVISYQEGIKKRAKSMKSKKSYSKKKDADIVKKDNEFQKKEVESANIIRE